MNLTRLPLLITLAALPAFGQSSSHSSAPLSAQDLAAITQRGTVLAAYDQAARYAVAAVATTHPPDGKIVRYIARRTADGWTVDFGRLSPDNSTFLTAYEAVQTDAPTHFAVGQYEPEREDTGFNLAAARAIDLALKDFRGVPDRPYTVAVLPGGTRGNLVYFYPARVKEGVYPYGGDERYFISPDGAEIYEKRPMHPTVVDSIVIQPQTPPQPSTQPSAQSSASSSAQTPAPPPTPSPDAPPAAGYHTHSLTNQPEDTDVFLVLTRQPLAPEYVRAGGHIYKIQTDGTIQVDPADTPH